MPRPEHPSPHRAKRSRASAALPVLPAHPRLPVLGQVPGVAERADAARNRTRILETARKLMQRRPMCEIGMDELADAAGVGKGTLYRRFADRAALCRALLDDEERKLQDQVLRGFGLPPETPAWHRLEVLLDALLEFVLDNAPLLAEAETWEHGDTARFEAPPYAWRRNAIRTLVEAARREQDRSTADAPLLADLVLATLDPVLLQWHASHGSSRASLRSVLQRAWVDNLR